MQPDCIEESPCSHGPEMAVVFVPDETISLGNDIYILTAAKYSKCLLHMNRVALKVPQ